MAYNVFDKKISGGSIKNKIMPNKELAEELFKPVIRKLKERKVNWTFISNIWAADLADMQLISKSNKGFRYLLCLIDIYNKYSWVIALTNKKRNYNYCFSKDVKRI